MIVSRGGFPLIALPYMRSTRLWLIPKPMFPISCQGTIRGGSLTLADPAADPTNVVSRTSAMSLAGTARSMDGPCPGRRTLRDQVDNRSAVADAHAPAPAVQHGP